MARILRGDIRWADLNPVRGSEQGGLRPVLILSQDIFNARSGTVIAMAITNQPKKTAFLSPWSLAPPPCRKNPGSRSARSVLLPWSASAKNSPRPAPRNWPWWWRGWGRLWGNGRAAADTPSDNRHHRQQSKSHHLAVPDPGFQSIPELVRFGHTKYTIVQHRKNPDTIA